MAMFIAYTSQLIGFLEKYSGNTGLWVNKTAGLGWIGDAGHILRVCRKIGRGCRNHVGTWAGWARGTFY